MLIGFFPEVLARFLPKPGRWMGVLKKIFAIPVLLTCFWLAWVLGHLASQEQPNNEVVRWQAYDEQKISSLLQQNKAVFIDFTAKWCLTCLANDKIALDTGHFAELVKNGRLICLKPTGPIKTRISPRHWNIMGAIVFRCMFIMEQVKTLRLFCRSC